MTRRNSIFIAFCALLLLVMLFLGWYWYTHRTPTSVIPGDTTDLGTGYASNSSVTVRPPPNETGGTETGSNQSEPRLFQIHDKPIVSSVVFSHTNGPVVRFMEQGSGHVYEYTFLTKEKVRISNTSIPQIARAVWSASGGVVAFQYEQDNIVHTAIGVLASSTSAGDSPFQRISFLPEGIRSIALSPDGTGVVYVLPSNTGSNTIIARSDGSNPKLLYTSILKQWNVSWPAKNVVLLAFASGIQEGVTYKFSPTDGKMSILTTSPKLFNGTLGSEREQYLTTDPKTGYAALLDQKTGTVSDFQQISWPEKCAFIKNATSSVVCAEIPKQAVEKHTEWERGEFSTQDILVAMNFFDKYAMTIIPKEEIADKVFDMVNLSATEDGKYIVFKNRMDGLLWGVRVPGGIQ